MDEQYIIKQVVDVDSYFSRVFFKVIWEGYSEVDATWEPAKTIMDRFDVLYQSNRIAQSLIQQIMSMTRWPNLYKNQERIVHEFIENINRLENQ